MLDPEIISPEILGYINSFNPVLSEVFENIEAQAREKNYPVVSKDTGSFLKLMVKISRSEKVLEIGCNIGYSALWLATGLPENGHLDTIEISEEIANQAKINFESAGVGKKITVHTGSAIDVIPLLKDNYDMVFIDAAKKQYKKYLDLCLPKLKKRGIILVDNVLWHGRVAGENIDKKRINYSCHKRF